VRAFQPSASRSPSNSRRYHSGAKASNCIFLNVHLILWDEVPGLRSEGACSAERIFNWLAWAQRSRRELDEKERRELRSMARRSTAQGLALRARIVLACLKGKIARGCVDERPLCAMCGRSILHITRIQIPF
jgi:hypothetical protein